VGVEGVFPRTVFYLNGIPIRDTVFQTWIINGLLIVFAIWASFKYRVFEPKTWQLGVEYLVEYIEGLIRDLSGRAIPELVPYLGTMIVYIVIANLVGLVPLFLAPTRDLNTTAALSLVSLGSTQYYGIRARGLKAYLRSYIEPVIIMLPLNILGDLSRVLSMSLRLFGNVLAGEIIGAVMFTLVPVLSPLPLNLLSMITGVLQALVFTVLTLVFVVDAIGEVQSTDEREQTLET
jgi:F-type H+-transporting ATPase subunit a